MRKELSSVPTEFRKGISSSGGIQEPGYWLASNLSHGDWRFGDDVQKRAQETSTIFFGGSILTITDEQPEVEAMIVRNGRILALGERRKIFNYHTSRTQMVNLQGGTLMPGFIDPHVHLAWSAFLKSRCLDVSPSVARDKQHILYALRVTACKKELGEWVIAFGYDPARQSPEAPPLTAAELDRASISNPVFVIGQSGEVAYVNHKAIEVMGGASHIDDFKACTCCRDSQGALSGEIHSSNYFAEFFKSYPQSNFEQNLRDCKVQLWEWAQQGCTTVYETALGGLWGQEEVRLFLELASDPTTPMRFRAALIPTDDLPHTAGIKPMQGNDRLCFVGINVWADRLTSGSEPGFGLPMLANLHRGTLSYDEEGVKLQMRDWHKAGWQLVLQAIGQTNVERALQLYETILTGAPKVPHRHRIERCAGIDEAQIARARNLGLSISQMIGQVCRENGLLGRQADEPARSIVPLALAFEQGLKVSLHSDSPVTPVAPLRQVQTAMTWLTSDGAEMRHPQLTIDQALKTVTLFPAYQCFLEHETGSFEVGKVADMVMLDRNPRTVEPTEIAQIKVLDTYLGGVRQTAPTHSHKKSSSGL